MGLRCASCGYDNDPTRVYCHSCGIRLERGGAAPPPSVGFTRPSEIKEAKRRRTPLPWGKYFGFLLKLSLLFGLITAIAFALMPPRNVPSPVAGDAAVAKKWSGLVSLASDAASLRFFAVPAAELQKWLAASVQMKSSGEFVVLDPRRVYIVPLEGKLRLGLELGLPVDFSIFMEGEYIPVRSGNQYTLQATGYSIGRLPLPAPLGYPLERQFEGLRDALVGQLAQFAKASSIEIAPDKVSLCWSGAPVP